jgi:hypothetical protein
MKRSIHAVRTLAVDPTTSGFGFAVLEGSKLLVDWGLAHMAVQDDGAYRARIEKLLDRVRPQLLVVENMKGSRRSDRAVRRAQIAARAARARGIEVERVTRAQVSQKFAASGMTRWEVAVAVSHWFPELSPSLPKKRRIWETEDRRMAIFVAASLALSVA